VVTRRLTDDRGFSLTELIVVLLLLGVVLGISYGGLIAVYRARDVSERRAFIATEVGNPLATFEKMLTQATYVDAAGPYSVTFRTDRDNNDVQERNLIEATAGGALRHRIWLLDQYGNNTSLEYDATWSEHNVNVARSQPLFQYSGDTNGDGTMEPLSGVINPQQVQYVDVTIVVEYDEHDYSDGRSAFMRNR
jgi:prepilin-type N-terminal cleavage/methylation domain-containing protein